MPSLPMPTVDREQALTRWLAYQESLNPQLIDLGLARIRPVAQRLGLKAMPCPVISVAGTNGKGSTVAFVEALAAAEGLRVASYGSPYLRNYAECVRLDGQPRADAEIVAAFEAVEAQRHGVALTAFEFRTLAAIFQLCQLQPQLMVLEVGMGGRLDAVNVIDADVAVVSSIGLDHQQWLGNSLADIAREKCGIARRGCPLVCADRQAAALIAPHAATVEAVLHAPDQIADRCLQVDLGAEAWDLRLGEDNISGLPMPALLGVHQCFNAAAAIRAVQLSCERRTLSRQVIECALSSARVPGRLQMLNEHPLCVVDVAHNPAAATAVARWLQHAHADRRWHAVCAMYADKDHSGVLSAMTGIVSAWYLAALPGPRGAQAGALVDALAQLSVREQVAQRRFPNVASAWQAALAAAAPDDGIVGFGSFETVRGILLARE